MLLVDCENSTNAQCTERQQYLYDIKLSSNIKADKIGVSIVFIIVPEGSAVLRHNISVLING